MWTLRQNLSFFTTVSKQFITIQIHTYYTMILKWFKNEAYTKSPSQRKCLSECHKKARKLISLHQFSFSWVPFWKAFPFSAEQSRTGIFTQRYFLLIFSFSNFVLWTLCPFDTLSSENFVLGTPCPHETLSPRNIVRWILCPLDNGHFVIRTLCTLDTLSFRHFVLFNILSSWNFVLWILCPFNMLSSEHFVLRKLCPLDTLSYILFFRNFVLLKVCV